MMNPETANAYFSSFTRVLQGIRVSNQIQNPLILNFGVSEVVNKLQRLKHGTSKVMLIGNGGSAAIAQHIQVDLCKAVGIRAMSFYEASVLTALSNDLAYEEAFEKGIDLWANPGDVVIAISSSGSSENILRACQRAIELGCYVITLSGFSVSNPLRKLGHINFYAPSNSYGEVEMAHSLLAHCITDFAQNEEQIETDYQDTAATTG